MTAERTFLPHGNYKIKSIFSDSLYLTPLSEIITFLNTSSENNQKWKLQYVEEKNAYKISNIAQPDKYLTYNSSQFIVLKNIGDSTALENYWIPYKIASNTYIITNLKEYDKAWDIYDLNGDISDQPLLLQQLFYYEKSNQMFIFEKI
uniref:HA-II protein n=1 Tax=Clostridium botulinum TaxID=1491 RepID=O06016_CLOBO|nr:HA-II [Clostridium botulinum]